MSDPDDWSTKEFDESCITFGSPAAAQMFLSVIDEVKSLSTRVKGLEELLAPLINDLVATMKRVDALGNPDE